MLCAHECITSPANNEGGNAYLCTKVKDLCFLTSDQNTSLQTAVSDIMKGANII